MASNRLYIGNTETKEYFMIAKSSFVCDSGWVSGYHDELFFEYIGNDDFMSETFPNGKTNLVFFTEDNSELEKDFITNGKRIDNT